MDDDKFKDSNQPGPVSVVNLVKKCKRIVEFFNRNIKAMYKFRFEFEKYGLSYTGLIQSVSTRWNSIYYMLQRINEVLNCVTVVQLREKHSLILLTPSEIEALPEVISILKPFADVTAALNGNTFVTISLIIPYTTSLLKELNSAEPCTETGKFLRTN